MENYIKIKNDPLKIKFVRTVDNALINQKIYI